MEATPSMYFLIIINRQFQLPNIVIFHFRFPINNLCPRVIPKHLLIITNSLSPPSLIKISDLHRCQLGLSEKDQRSCMSHSRLPGVLYRQV